MIFFYVSIFHLSKNNPLGEDDDISKRIRINGLVIDRYPINIARYKMLQHPKENPNRHKGKNLRNADRYDSFDGLRNLR